MKKKILLFVMMMVLVFSFTACGGDKEEKKSEKKAQVEQKEAKTEAKKEEKSAEVDLDDYKAIGVYEQGKVLDESISEFGDSCTYHIAYETDANVDEAIKYFEDMLSGYDNFHSMDVGFGKGMAAVLPNGYGVQITVTELQGVVSVDYSCNDIPLDKK